MLRTTAFPTPYNSVPVLNGTHACNSLVSIRVIYSHCSFTSRFEFRQPHVHYPLAVRGGGLVVAAEKKRQQGGAGIAEMEEYFDEVEDVFDEYDDNDDDELEEIEEEEEEEDDDDGDGGEEMLPLEQMRKWFAKKPKGFGEGKVYDTSVEDKLLEEMRRSSEAQVANLKKLKANPVQHSSNKIAQKKKDAEVVVPVGCRVRLVNLPKKKNIHRDLKSAFEGIPGIMNIVPAVTGNKKTRDPICKGFAFVDFKHEKDAVRFVESYTGQTISFGKIQKQIRCELPNEQSSSSSSLELSKNLKAAPHLMVSAFEEESNEDSNMDDSAFSSWDEANSDELKESEEQNQEFATTLELGYDDSVEMSIDSEIDLLPSEQVHANLSAEQNSYAKVRRENDRKKKITSKKKVKKVLDIPGSAKRLKIKEKAVLSDVFSKYTSKTALGSKGS